MIDKQILVINPNPHDTRIAVYQNNKIAYLKTMRHKEDDLSQFADINDQLEFRYNLIEKELRENLQDLNQIHIIVARGGLVKPVPSGVYEVNEPMLNDLKTGFLGKHAHNLGGMIANKLLDILPSAKAYIADPIVVDEMEDIARVSGNPMFERKSVFHALNQKTVARKYAKSVNKDYEELNLIVVHIEMGISIGAHKAGRVIDVNQSYDGGGPFSYENSGQLPLRALLKLAFSGKYTEQELAKLINEGSGYKGYLGTSNPSEIEDRIRGGDEQAEFISQAMAYQISKTIGSGFTVLMGEVDAIVLSGEAFHCNRFSNSISERVNKIAPVAIYPDEDVMDAMAANGLAILKNEANIQEYK
jgi:butyrate kinase